MILNDRQFSPRGRMGEEEGNWSNWWREMKTGEGMGDGTLYD